MAEQTTIVPPEASPSSLEIRVAALEEELAALKRGIERTPKRGWLKRFIGSADNLPGYDEAVRYGREFRQSQFPSDQSPA